MEKLSTGKHKYRYPGTNFFEEEQQEIFFGREGESEELLHAIKAQSIFVIFANSGIGKTSLLNACLIPSLKREEFLPIRFRFQEVSNPPLEEIRSKLMEYQLRKDVGTDEKLWHFVKTCDFGDKRPLLIFDQFEEFFNHPKPKRDECISQIADLTRNYLPSYVLKEMRKKFRDVDPSEEELKYYSPVQLKFLFLIRSDKLNLLDDLSHEIPPILHNRFHLKPLGVIQAQDAILKPASLEKNGFATPPINLDEVFEQMCTYLKNEEDEVESFQLQILCQQLEKRVIDEYDDVKDKNPAAIEDALTITKDELGGEKGMNDIVENYYTNQVKSIPDPELRKKASLLMEDELQIKERRVSLPEAFLTNKGYPLELLEYLVDKTRLIRVDRLRKERYFELSHDKLLDPILKSRELRVKQDQQQKRIQELEDKRKAEAERNRKLEDEREREKKVNRKLKMYVAVMGAFFLAMLALTVYVITLQAEAKIKNVNDWITKEDYKKADSVLNDNNGIFSILYSNTLRSLNDSISNKKIQKHRFDSLSNEADKLAGFAENNNTPAAEDLIKAYKIYDSIGTMGFTPVNDTEKIGFKQERILEKANHAFKDYIDRTDAFYHSALLTKDITDARQAFETSVQLYDLITTKSGKVDATDYYLNKFDFLKQKLSK